MKNFKISIFSTQPYDRTFLTSANGKDEFAKYNFQLEFYAFPLSEETVPLAQASDAVCVFVNDVLDSAVLNALHMNGTRAILLRCAGYNNVDLVTAEKLGIFVAHVPAYAPEAVAEYAVALIQTLNRQTHRAYNRVREGNFSLVGLMGFTMSGKTVGVVGTGKIGIATARILKGFGCRLLAYDPFPVKAFEELGDYVELDQLLEQSDIVSLHCPLMDATRHIINDRTLGKMKEGAMLVNTSRGGLVSRFSPHRANQSDSKLRSILQQLLLPLKDEN
jgi:D-lactate dehydrogenase